LVEVIATATTLPGRSQTFQSIQILRAVAALGVVFYHLVRELHDRFGLPADPDAFLIGAAGVDLFFVISGFVMVYASERMFGRAGAPAVFMLRRLARIVPLYWSLTSVIVVYMAVAHRAFPLGFTSALEVLTSYAFIPYQRGDGLYFPVHGLGWTLNYEMFFYAVFAIALLFPRRIAISGVIVLYTALVIVSANHQFPEPVNFWCGPIIIEFCFGLLIAAAYQEGLRLPRAGTFVLLGLALAGYAISITTGFQQFWRFLQWGMPGALIVAACTLVGGASYSGAFARAFGFLGEASYSLYLVHPLAFPLIRRLVGPWLDLPLIAWAYPVILVAGSIAAAILSYLLFERPITRALQQRIGVGHTAARTR
jgi:exopolysaccharide production protein ExoZ